ncbi:hypothetical protein EON80_09585, partial [bacterium]
MGLFNRKSSNPYALLKLWELIDDTIVTSQGVYLCGFELFGMDSEHTDIRMAAQAAEILYDGLRSDVPEQTLLQFLIISNSDYREAFARFEAVPEPTNPVLALQRRRRLDFLKRSNLRRFTVYVFAGRMEGFTANEFDSLSLAMHTNRVTAARALGRKVKGLLERTGQIVLQPLDTAQLTTLFDEALNPHQSTSAESVSPNLEPGLPVNGGIDGLSCAERLMRTN